MSSRPFGYRKGHQGRLVLDPREGPIVAELFRRRGDGASIAELRRLLNAAEVKTTQGGEWASSGVGKLLGYRTYLGELRHGEFVNQVWTFRNGQGIRMQMYASPEEALEAVGLSE